MILQEKSFASTGIRTHDLLATITIVKQFLVKILFTDQNPKGTQTLDLFFTFTACCSFCGSQASEKLDMMKTIKDYKTVGRGCGSVGRAVAPNTRDARFETGHRQNFIYLLNNKTIKETKIKEEAGNGPSKKMQD